MLSSLLNRSHLYGFSVNSPDIHILVNCYRPQTKFAKVMFLQVSVCPRGGGGVHVTWHAPRHPCMPPQQPSMPPGIHAHPPASTHAPPAATHAPPGSHTPPRQPHAPRQPCMPPHTGNLHFHCRNTFFTSFFNIYID